MTEDETPQQTAERHLADDAAAFFAMKADTRRQVVASVPDLDPASREYLTAFANAAQRAADAYRRKAQGAAA
jgi:hypothetical protein